MKKLLLASFVIAFLAVASCLAQGGGSIKVTITAGAPSTSCTFAATSVSEDITRTVSTTGGGITTGKPAFGPIILTKVIDKCSVPLYKSLFTGATVRLVVVSLFDSTNGAAGTEVLRLTLTNSIISGITDADSAIGPAEKVTLAYAAITIFDPIDNTTATCSVATGLCN
jgi:type VI protein secretion system component Hcp